MKKGLIGVLVLLGFAALAGVLFPQQLALQGVALLSRLQYSIGPNRAADWAHDRASLQQAGDSESAERPPNIILIVADDLGWNDLSFGGGGIANGTVPTPHINAIAAEGALFGNGYSASGTCAPSRAALMTGRYPTRFGFEFTPTPPGMLKMVSRLSEQQPGEPDIITYFDEKGGDTLPFEEMGLPSEEVTLAETLREQGYYTAHIGKWHLGRSTGMTPIEQGFDDSLLMHSGLYLPEDHPDVVNSKQDFDPIDKFLWKALRYAASFNNGEAFEPGGYLTDYYTEEAIKVIEANKHRPFFLYLAHWAPHTPLQATRADYEALSHIEDHTERVYAAMIRALDRGVGQVLAALKANGIDDNTLVIFTSDNGGAGYVGLPDINNPYRGWKISFFEGGIHVPYFMRWPAQIKAGTRFDKPVHHFDIFSTAAAAGGATANSNKPIDGVNLLPFITRKGRAASGEAIGDTAPHQRLFWRSGHYQAVIADGWKLQRTARPDKQWLFHLDVDPAEQDNVAVQNPARVQQMLAMLDRHNAAQRPPAWPALLEAPILIDKTLKQEFNTGDEFVYWPN